MQKLCHICFFLMLSVAMHCSYAANSLIINDNSILPIVLNPYLYQWQGENESLESLYDKTYLFSFWTPVEAKKSSNLFKHAPSQMMMVIENHQDKAVDMLFVHPQITADRIKIQYWANGKKQEYFETGNDLPFSSRPIHHRDFVFPLHIDAQQSLTIMMEIHGRQDIFLNNFSLWNRADYFEKTDLALIGYAMLFGILLLLMLYHALLFLIVKDRCQLWFALIIAAFLLRALTMSNIAFEFFWPNVPSLQNFCLVGSAMLSSLLTALFLLDYLPVTQQTPKLLLSYRIYIASHLLAMALQAWYHWPVYSFAYWLMFALPFMVMIIASNFWLYRQGNLKAGVFLLGYFFALASGFIAAGNQFFSLNLTFNPSEEIGQLLQILVLSLALTWSVGVSREKAHIAYAKNKAKSDFLAKMSHEIRTPINGVLGMAQLLSETPLSRKQQHYADVINHCSKTLLNVINNILEYSKIEAGKLELETTPLNIDDLLLNNNGLFWPQIHNKGLEYKFYLDPKIPHNLLGDPTRLQQIFNNVFSNAIKFTDHGTISLHVSAKAIQNDNVIIRFSIKDTGIGIKEEDIEHIFAPFSQANASTTRLYGGSGLGLNITQQIIKLMGGSILFDSKPKMGTHFAFEIPFKLDANAEYLRQKNLGLFRKKSALVLSKENVDIDIVSNALKHWNIQTRHMEYPESAFTLITETPNGFDVICLELSLFNEYTSAQKKILHTYGQNILIYDCTFNGSSADHYLEGFHLLTAPFSIRHIYNTLANIFSLPELDANIDKPSKVMQFGKDQQIRLLVAEDDATNRLVIRAILKKLHIEHDIVANGILAIERYQANPQDYDLLLMDCEMPEMNGYQAANAIRAYEKSHGLKAVPIVALTAHVLPEYEQRCYENGMNLVIAKPVNIDELTAAFNRFIGIDNRNQTP